MRRIYATTGFRNDVVIPFVHLITVQPKSCRCNAIRICRTTHGGTMNWVMTVASTLTLLCGGCGYRTSETGIVHHFALRPDAAARCFASNAEEHSSSLVAEILGEGNSYDVAVKVRNGLPYATAHIESEGTAARGIVELNVRSSQGSRALLEALVEGC